VKKASDKKFKPKKRKAMSLLNDIRSAKSVPKDAPVTKDKPVVPDTIDTATVSVSISRTSEAPLPYPDDPDDSGDIYSRLSSFGDNLDDIDGLPDPVAMIDRAISADLDPSIFTERSFDVAPNIVEWCRNPEFLGYTGEMFPKQLQVLVHFFSDVCHFCSDTDYIHDVPVDASMGDVLDRFTLLQYGVCPKCKRNRTELLTEWQRDSRFWDHHEFDNNVNIRPVPPNEFVGVWGQRSGKSYSVATFAAPYILHRYLSLPSPTRYFNQPNNVVFEAAFVAPTLHQINKYMWGPFREVYDSSPWFREFRKYLVSEGKRTGVQLYHSGSTFLAFPSKRLAVHILAASSSGLRGGTRIFAAQDELGWFNTNEDGKRRAGTKDGTEVFNALSNSLTTIRTQADYRRESLGDYNSLDAYMFNISSPSSISDPIMQRAAVATRAPRMFYTHYKTWEVNPKEKEYVIREQKAGDMESFMRDFCAIPPRALSPFLPEHRLVQDLLHSAGEEQLFKYHIERQEDEDGLRWVRPILGDISYDPFNPRVLAIDNGETTNSFALCVGRYLPDIDGILFEEFVEVAPVQGSNVDLAWCYDKFIVPLVNSFNFLHVGFDRWNSAYAVHDLRTNPSLKVDAQRYSLKWKDFTQFRDELRGMKVWLPAPECPPDDLLQIRDLSRRAEFPRAHFQLQLTTVNQFGNKLYKPDNGNDDLFRVGALAHSFIQRYKKEYQKQSAHISRRKSGTAGSVGIFRGASRGGRGGGRMGSFMGNTGSTSEKSAGAYRSGRR